jgi:DNA-binding beta-propeller fold protein YncE
MVHSLTGRIARCLFFLACVLATSGAVARDPIAGAQADLSGYVFVANRASSEIAVIDVGRDEVVKHVALSAIPHQFVVSDQLQKLVATHLEQQAISIADLARGDFDVLQVEIAPERLQIGPDGRLLAISSGRDNRILLVSLATGEILHDVAWPQHPGDLIFDREGKTLFIGSRSSGRIAVVDVIAGTIGNEILLSTKTSVLPGIVGLVQTPGSQFGFALHGERGQISVIDLRDLQILTVLHLPGPAVQAFPDRERPARPGAECTRSVGLNDLDLDLSRERTAAWCGGGLRHQRWNVRHRRLRARPGA